MSSDSEKLAHVQVIISCPHFVAQMWTCEDKLTHNLSTVNPDQLQTNHSFQPFKIQTSPDFKSPLYMYFLYVRTSAPLAIHQKRWTARGSACTILVWKLF